MKNVIYQNDVMKNTMTQFFTIFGQEMPMKIGDIVTTQFGNRTDRNGFEILKVRISAIQDVRGENHYLVVTEDGKKIARACVNTYEDRNSSQLICLESKILDPDLEPIFIAKQRVEMAKALGFFK